MGNYSGSDTELNFRLDAPNPSIGALKISTAIPEGF